MNGTGVSEWCLDRVGGLDLGHFFLPCRALSAPRFVFSAAGGAFPRRLVVVLRGTLSGRMILRAVAACYCCPALGSYVAIFVPEALSQTALSVVSFALEDLALPDQSLVDDSVCILRSREFYNYRRRRL